MPNWFNVGKIVNTHGIHGEVRVISKTDFPEQRYAVGSKLTLFMNGKEVKELVVTSHRTHKNFDLLTFENYTNVNDVVGMKEGILKVDEAQLSSLPEDEFYFHEIIGCDVYSSDGTQIGTVKEILTPGANDVWVVQTQNNKDVYIPYIPQVVKTVHIEKKEIIIEPMEGLLE